VSKEIKTNKNKMLTTIASTIAEATALKFEGDLRYRIKTE
jgi:hypothetical protein